jgi:tetratricopeptide (TPR) repeat protein
MFAFAAIVSAQKGAAPTPAPRAATTTTPTPDRTAEIPGGALGLSVQLTVTGRVLLENRQTPSEPVPVDYSCHGQSSTHLTDAKGRFSIPAGQQQVARSTTISTDLPRLDGCRVQVRLPGFEDLSVSLKAPHSLNDLNVGDLILKSSGGSVAAVFSAVSANAPNKARGNYIRALEEIGANKYPEAVASLDKAIRVYPQYAAAYQFKGQVLEQMGQREAARAAYQQAVTADPAYGKPLIQLAEMAADDQDATEAARWAAAVNKLAPGAFPSMYLLEGSSYFNLGRFDEAAKAAQAGLEADRTNFYPRLHKLMGECLYRKRDYAGALEHLKQYVKDSPDAPDAAEAKARAESCERLARLNPK